MEHSFYIKSSYNNCYHFDTNNGLFSLVHPALFVIHTLKEEGKNDKDIEQILFEKFDSIDSAYYLNYYLWLENQENKVKINYLDGITPFMIKNALSNLNQLTFEVTDACNLKCKYCSYGELYENYDKRTNKYQTFEKAKIALDCLSSYWKSDYNISTAEPMYISFYGGEPLLNMSFVKQIVQYFEEFKAKRNFIFSMTTNAVLLEKFIPYLEKHKFRLLISLDGNKENNCHRITKNGTESFDIVYRNIHSLYRKYPDYFKKYVNFNSVIHNKNSVNNIIKFFQHEFNKIPTIGELNPNGIKTNRKSEFKDIYSNMQRNINILENQKIPDDILFHISPLSHSFILFNHQYNEMIYDNYNELLMVERTYDKLPTGTCLPFSKKLFITVNGKILPCEKIG